MRPPDLARAALGFVGVLDAWHAMSDMLRNAAGNISAAEKTFIPSRSSQSDPHCPHLDGDLCRDDRAGALHRLVPALMLVGLPRLYGAWHQRHGRSAEQHGGAGPQRHRSPAQHRTVYMNPISRFIYWNMNYHIEHHMFPWCPIMRCRSCMS